MKLLSKFSYKLALTIIIFFIAAVGSVSLYNKNISSILEEDAYADLSNANAIRSVSVNERLESTEAILSYLSTIVADNIYDPIQFSSKLTYAGSEYQLGVINFISLNQVNEILSNRMNYSSQYADSIKETIDTENPSIVQHKEGNSDVVSILYPVLKQSDDANDETKVYGIISCTMTLDKFMEKYFASPDKRISTCIINFVTNYSFTIITNEDGSYKHLKEPYNDKVSVECSSSSHNSLLEAYNHSDGDFFKISYNDHSYYATINDFLYKDWNTGKTLIISSMNTNVLLSTNNTIASRNIQLSLVVILLFVLIILSGLALLYYYQNKQNIISETLAMEKEKYKILADDSEWHIWEYDHVTQVISNSTDTNFEPIMIHQYRSQLIIDKLVLTQDLPAINNVLDDIMNGKMHFVGQYRRLSPAGDYQWTELKGTTIFDNHNKPIKAFFRTTNIHQQKLEMDRLKTSTEHDALTGLLKFGTAKERISAVLDDIATSSMHGLVILEIDNFANLNSEFGHTFADALLLDISSRLSKKFSGDNILARIGQERFMIFIHNVSELSQLETYAGNINSMLSEMHLGADFDLRITASIGLSLFPNHGSIFDELLNAADMALYVSKKTGKDRYTLYDSELITPAILKEYRASIKQNKNIITDSDSDSVIDSDIIYKVVDILFTARDLDVSFNLAFSLIANYYGINQIGIAEYHPGEQIITTPYCWNDDIFQRFSTNMTAFSYKEGDLFSFFKNQPGDVFYTNNLQEMDIPKSSFTDMTICAGVNSIFQCGIRDNGELKAYLFAYMTSGEPWENNEISSLILLTKVIGGYLLKLRSQEGVNRNNYTDILTGSYNITHFNTIATKLLVNNPNQKYALVYMDIDKFKLINDKYGYSIGDYILIEFAKVLLNFVEDDETYARGEADKFVVLLKIKDEEDLHNRIHTLFNQLSKIRKTELNNFRMSIIAGAYIIEDMENMSVIVDRANIARKNIVERHHSTYQLFNESMKNNLLKQKEIESIMEDALKNDEFLVYYQPKFNLYSNRMCGSEALVRWFHDGKLISPGDFIPIFEDNGFIIDVDFYVYEQVCKKLRELIDEGYKVYPVSVNFSRAHFKNNNIIKRLEDVINKYDIDPRYIHVEITESAVAIGDSFAPTILNEIHKLGLKLSMDDFGSGLSSLNSLRRLPFDILKLDKDFFQHDVITQRERIVISNIINLARELDMEIIAEGIETEEQAQFLRNVDCPIVQGFLFSRPIPCEEFVEKYIKI